MDAATFLDDLDGAVLVGLLGLGAIKGLDGFAAGDADFRRVAPDHAHVALSILDHERGVRRNRLRCLDGEVVAFAEDLQPPRTPSPGTPVAAVNRGKGIAGEADQDRQEDLSAGERAGGGPRTEAGDGILQQPGYAPEEDRKSVV